MQERFPVRDREHVTVDDDAGHQLADSDEAPIWYERVLSFLFDPAVVGIVRSSSASEADVDDHDLMLYYATHPETELNESLVASG